MKNNAACFYTILLLLSFPFLSSAQRIATGGFQSLAICSDSTVKAWGGNGDGELGIGSYSPSFVPVPVIGLTGIIAVSGGYEHSLALKNDSTVWNWGNNAQQELGDGTTTYSNIPIPVTTLSGIVAVSAGGYHNLALQCDSTIRVWGWGSLGQLGNGADTTSSFPVHVSGLTGVIAIGGGQNHSLALKSDGTVWAWGNGTDGELGNGGSVNSNVPVPVLFLSGIVAISAGAYHNLALKNDGTVWAWGFNNNGELGIGTNTGTNAPVMLDSISGVVAIAAGGNHSLALKNDGTLWSWGTNVSGELGDGFIGVNSNLPMRVSTPVGVVAFSAGAVHTLILRNDSTLWACGYNWSGALGDSTNVDKSSPVKVHELCPVSTESYCLAHYITAYDSTLNSFTLNVDSATAAIAVSYEWNFGDGTTSTLVSPSHTYTVDTVYDVCMTIHTAAGDSCTYCHTIGKNYLGNIIRTGGFMLNVHNPNTTTDVSEDHRAELPLDVFPNPTSGVFTVTIGEGQLKATYGEFLIYNSVGEKVYSKKSELRNTVIDLSGYSNGIYFLCVEAGNEVKTKKIVISK